MVGVGVNRVDWVLYMASMSQIINDVIAILEAAPVNLVLAPPAVNARNIPNTITETVFSVTMQTQNTNKFRDKSPGGHMRLEHALTVSLLCRIYPNNQMQGYTNAIDIEETIITALLIQSNLPALRVLFEDTTRSLQTNNEYLLTEINFSIEQSFVVT